MLSEYDDGNGGVILDGSFDPDAQATVTDYIDYTEYLPADLIRSLTLIRGLDERYLGAAQGVHDLTKEYGQLPEIPANTRPNPQHLRKDISFQLDRAINARESAYAEACRLYDVVDHHFNRLECIRQKLETLPKPASQEASPPPAQAGSKRAQAPKKKGAEGPPPRTRITLRLDGQDNTAAPAQKSRSRRSMVSAEHLSRFNPDSPIASTEHSDAEDAKARRSTESLVEPDMTPGTAKTKKEKQQAMKSRPSASGGGQAAAVSTSNALAMLRPPPEDAQPGSIDMPWLRLTEWEMTKLRKKMKKNAIWQPSEVMIHRELALRGRGWEAYRAAKTQAEADGSEFVDCDDIENTYIPGKFMKKTDANKDSFGTTETKLSNRGMKLNEAKKLKRENLAREQTAAAASFTTADQSSKHPGHVTNGNQGGMQEKPPTRASKRKLEESAPEEPTELGGETETRGSLRSSTKRRKTSTGASGDTPLESISNPSVNTATPTATATAAADGIPSGAKKPSPLAASPAESKQEPVLTVPASDRQPPSRRHSFSLTADQAKTVGSAVGRDLRRKSATPARRTPLPESMGGPTRRRKRPAPGPVSSGQDGGAAVSYGRRKAKLSKKRAGTREPDQRDGVRVDEDGVLEQIDSSEPRYCMCGDVSFGTMICCENNDVSYHFKPQSLKKIY